MYKILIKFKISAIDVNHLQVLFKNIKNVNKLVEEQKYPNLKLSAKRK